MRERIYLDIGIAVAACIVANVVYNNFERHLPAPRRVAKGAVMFAILGTLGFVLGRAVFWSVIGLMTVGQLILHAWWFPKNGVNGLTAEPRDRYLELIAGKRGRARGHVAE